MKNNLLQMKKILSILALTVLIGSCKKAAAIDPIVACEKAGTTFNDATSAYIADITNVKKCQAFISAAESLIKNCPTISAADKKAAQASIATVKCN
jgi:hypothetical protein